MAEQNDKDAPKEAKPSAAPLPTPPPLPPRAPQAAVLSPSPPQQQKAGRRGFLKAVLALGAFLTMVTFVPWGQYLSSSVSHPGAYTRQKVVTDINPLNGSGSGKAVNVSDLTTFPSNGSWLITYPTSGDLTLDSQNPDTFVKWQLIRLPEQLGGGSKDASAFVAFSKVCVHLWCSPNYDPEKTTLPANESYQCPCHGSIYRIPDGLSIAGPASLQSTPNNAIPLLTLSADAAGDLYVEPPIFDVNHNGVVGYGRYVPGVTEPLTTGDEPYKQGSPYTSIDAKFNGAP